METHSIRKETCDGHGVCFSYRSHNNNKQGDDEDEEEEEVYMPM